MQEIKTCSFLSGYSYSWNTDLPSFFCTFVWLCVFFFMPVFHCDQDSTVIDKILLTLQQNIETWITTGATLAEVCGTMMLYSKLNEELYMKICHKKYDWSQEWCKKYFFVTSPCSNLFKTKYCILSVVDILRKSQNDMEEKEHNWTHSLFYLLVFLLRIFFLYFFFFFFSPESSSS